MAPGHLVGMGHVVVAPQEASSTTPTTLMIKNIPSRASAQEVLEALACLGIEGNYDFFHLPVHRQKGAIKPTNFRYAFINFKDSLSSQGFIDGLAKLEVKMRQSIRPLTCCVGRVQGVQQLLNLAENSHYSHGNSAPWFEVRPKNNTMALPPQTVTTPRPRDLLAPTKQSGYSHVLFGEPTLLPHKGCSKWTPKMQLYFGEHCDGSRREALGEPLYVQVDHEYYSDVA
eukprot:TRINITY_DN567_c0_g1_i1.p1 TRINITY_DN567_c0_g1~~TRINITY_DN567_c0_g1_i1.p1  ORF type:complete len:228 (+),score=40.11 TRINITY_DN567_c0_g1_i1:128-811(+)